MKFKSIAARITILVIPTIFITILSFSVLSYYVSNTRINNTINEKMHESLLSADLEIKLELSMNASVAVNFANYGKIMDISTFNHEKHKSFLSNGILSNENTFGGGVWYAPYIFDINSYYFGPFIYKNGSETVYVPQYGEFVDYFNEDWYIKGENSKGQITWSKVYYDPVSTITMITATKPFYDDKGAFIGVGTADMNIENIRRIVNAIRVGDTGRAFIVGANGEYITFFGEGRDVSKSILDDENEEFARLGRELVKNKTSGMTSFIYNGEKNRVYYTTMEDVGWTLAIIMEEGEINSSAINSFINMMLIPVIGLLFITLGVFAIIRYLRRIINKVNDFAELAASGNFSERIDVTEADEFGFMEQRLNIMISNMKDMSEHSTKLLTIAENANNSKSEFLSRMSHEIRTPMSAIMGMTQIAKASEDCEKIKDCLLKIDKASNHLLSLINDILDMSKIEANKLELSNEEFDFWQSLNNVFSIMQVKSDEKNQEFALNIDKSTPQFIFGDSLRLSQVITNLVGNAFKFTPENGKINVNVKELEADGDYSVISLSVADTGIGLNCEQQGRLFESFEQADISISRRFGGTGLGLAICKRIVEMMGGRIWVESEPDKGSIFTFTFRALKGSGEENDDNVQAARLVQDGDFNGKTILLAEDVEINREIVCAFLENTSVSIEHAENGLEAVDMFFTNPNKYDLILMDIQMPLLDGFEATKQIRAADNVKAKIIPILAMTANALSEDVNNCIVAGMNDHIAKPIDPETLLLKLSNYFLK